MLIYSGNASIIKRYSDDGSLPLYMFQPLLGDTSCSAISTQG